MTKITVLRLLERLDKAGPTGITGPTVAREFDEPAHLQRRMARVNAELNRLRRSDKVARSEKMEPSENYPSLPTHRWWITPKGLEYLRAGGYRGGGPSKSVLVAKDRLERVEEYKSRLADVKALATRLSKKDLIARDKFIAENGYKITNADLARIVGLSRERVRQILREARKEELCSSTLSD